MNPRWLQLALPALFVVAVNTASAQDGSGAAATAPTAGTDGAAAADDADFHGTLTLSGPAESLLVGQPFGLAGTLDAPPGSEIVSLDIGDGAWGRVHAFQVSPGGAPREQRVAADAVIFRAGRFTLEVTATLLLPDGGQATVASTPVVVEIRSVIANESAPDPAPSAAPFPVLTRDIRPIVAGGVLLAMLLGWMIATLVQRRRAAASYVPDPGPPPRPAWELALEALERLESEALLDAGRPLEFHMRLSEILRAYIGARFRFPALEATTSEIALQMAARPDDVGAWRHEILRVLRDMDMVKFARHAPGRDDSEALLAASRQLVLDLSARERSLADHDEATPEPDEATDAAALDEEEVP